MKRPKSFTEKKLKIDEHDVAILKAVSEGGARKTLKELSKITGLSIDLIHYRKKRLISHGYLSYFVAQPGFGTLHLTVAYLYIKTEEQSFPRIARSPLQVKTDSGVMFAILAKDLDDFSRTLDRIYEYYRSTNEASFLLTNKEIHVLNRYPFEYLL